jgi:DNA-binding MarR family transcriptional regulator
MDDPVELVERSMIRIRRNVARHQFGRILERELGPEISHVGLVDALSEGGEPNVGTVAERLGVDPSRASRLVAAAVDAGHVRRVASQEDGRRIDLELTASGKALHERVRQLRQAWLAEAMADWTDAERAAFARLLDRFVNGLRG